MLRVNLGFFREYDDTENLNEDYNHSFRNDDESLGVMLEKLEMFLKQMGFVLDGKRLELVQDMDIDSDNLDYGLADNIEVLFPSSSNQE